MRRALVVALLLAACDASPAAREQPASDTTATEDPAVVDAPAADSVAREEWHAEPVPADTPSADDETWEWTSC